MIRILVADDHTLVREGLKQILQGAADFHVAGEASNGLEVLTQLKQENWDILLLDMSMPGRSGIDLIKQIKEEKPRLPILVLTMHGEQQYAIRAFKAGVAGYLTKESAPAELVLAVRKVAAGGVYVSIAMAEKLALNLSPQNNELPHQRLSDREFDVFRRLVSGQTVSQIGDALSVSIKTISTHKTRILQKMEMQNQTELIRYAINHNLIDDAK
ncbi:MAG: response regulator transcription factor [Pseudomonadota bacterium]